MDIYGNIKIKKIKRRKNMSKKFINKSYVEGAVYQHSLELKKTGEQSKNPGTEYITVLLRLQLMIIG